MPSAALTHWQTDRMVRLGLMDSHCGALLTPALTLIAGGIAAPGPPRPAAPPAEEILQGYVMLVSGHFQGFCRDLYRECTQVFSATLPPNMEDVVQTQFISELKLNTGNPTFENIRRDFERFGFVLDFVRATPGNSILITHLGHLNHWRNTIAHQKPTPPPPGVPGVLTLANIQTWRAACDGLAASLDAIMKAELSRILGFIPW